LAGWIANPIVPDFDGQASIDTLSERLKVPLLAQMPAYQDIPLLAEAITHNDVLCRRFIAYRDNRKE
jgi:dethiobiotin synthetase